MPLGSLLFSERKQRWGVDLGKRDEEGEGESLGEGRKGKEGKLVGMQYMREEF